MSSLINFYQNEVIDRFHQGEGFNQVSEVHQEVEFNDGDQLHHVDKLDQYCQFNTVV